MENSPVRERRVFPRFPVHIPVSCFDPYLKKNFQTETQNISAEGLCLETDEVLGQGNFLEIFLLMPDDNEEIHRIGKIVWTNTTESGKHKVGIQLEEPKLKPIPLVLRIINYLRKY